MRNALITGATGGIGSSLIQKFHENGYTICATGTNNEKLIALQEKYQERLKIIRCDLSDSTQIRELVDKSNKFYGSTNILVNNAGITKDNLFIKMKDDQWDEVISINLNANFLLTKLIIKDMIKARWGRIINISSDAARIGNSGQANYVASKSAVEGMSKTIANEVATRGITVNCVAPGFINTKILDSVDEKRLNAKRKKYLWLE
jgi:Dehydrogenases with different specificities (related to short-chain alcohol dehydrogenases)